MPPVDIAELVARLEAANHGSDALNEAIADAVGYDDNGMKFVRSDPFGKSSVQTVHRTVPAYTTSLDAALTLVPEGWSVKLYIHPEVSDNPPECHCDVYKLGPLSQDAAGQLTRKKLWLFDAEQAPTPALALCIASLRARAGEEK